MDQGRLSLRCRQKSYHSYKYSKIYFARHNSRYDIQKGNVDIFIFVHVVVRVTRSAPNLTRYSVIILPLVLSMGDRDRYYPSLDISFVNNYSLLPPGKWLCSCSTRQVLTSIGV